MKPDEFWNSLETDGVKGSEKHQPYQAAYAKAAGSTFDYLNKHIFKKSGRSRNPSWKLLIGLSVASNEKVSLDEAIDYFLVQPVKSLAKEMEAKEQTPKAPAAPMTSKRSNVQQMELVSP